MKTQQDTRALGFAECSLAVRCGVHGAAALAGDLLVVLSMLMALFWILLNKQLLVPHSVIVIYKLWSSVRELSCSQSGVPLRYGMLPLLGCLLGVVVLEERLGLLAWSGGIMIVTATVALTTKSKAMVRDRFQRSER